jgi:hypothetical protein
VADADRIFVAGRQVELLEFPAAVSDAYDILADGGVSPDESARLAAGAARIGEDPVAFARKFLRLRDVAREVTGGG